MDELIKINSFTGERKLIRIQDDILEFDNRKISLNNVSDFRYGSEPIRLDMFTIGRKLVIELKYSHDEMAITLKYYFGISRNYFFNIYSSIINEIWQYTGVRLINDAIDKIKQGVSVQVGQCTIKTNGISFKDSFVEWENLIYQKNYDRITLTDKLNHKHWTNLYYLETYNFDLLIGILDWIYKYEGLNELKSSNN